MLAVMSKCLETIPLDLVVLPSWETKVEIVSCLHEVITHEWRSPYQLTCIEVRKDLQEAAWEDWDICQSNVKAADAWCPVIVEKLFNGTRFKQITVDEAILFYKNNL